MANEVSGKFIARDARMAEYLQLVRGLKSKIPRCDFKWIPKSKNNHTDSLAYLGAAKEFQFRREIFVEHITNPGVLQPTEDVLCLDTSLGWRDPIIAYLKDGTLSDDKAEAQKREHLATRYTLLRDVLYKKYYSKLHVDPYLRCLKPDETRRVMQEIHDSLLESFDRPIPCTYSRQSRVLLAQDVRGR